MHAPVLPRARLLLPETPPERRFDGRVPLEMYLNAYVDDRLQRGFTTNLSETGLYLNTLMHEPMPPNTPVGLEFVLPGVRETIWAAGEICFDAFDDYFLGRGIRFTAMAGLHGRLLREYCYRVRREGWRRALRSPAGGASA
jgi:hypothetical protein